MIKGKASEEGKGRAGQGREGKGKRTENFKEIILEITVKNI